MDLWVVASQNEEMESPGPRQIRGVKGLETPEMVDEAQVAVLVSGAEALRNHRQRCWADPGKESAASTPGPYRNPERGARENQAPPTECQRPNRTCVERREGRR